MSTKVKSFSGAATLTVRNNTDLRAGLVDVEFFRPDGQHSGIFPRADFLAAVQSELKVRLVSADAIVIERSELPEVTPTVPAGQDVTVSYSKAAARVFEKFGGHFLAATTVDDLRNRARIYLALAEYLDANPPIDEAQVSALAGLLVEADWTGLDADESEGLARRLVAKGVRIEVRDE